MADGKRGKGLSERAENEFGPRQAARSQRRPALHQESILLRLNMMASLLTLPTELLEQVISYIDDRDHAILDLRTTCKTLASQTSNVFAKTFFSARTCRLTPRGISELSDCSKDGALRVAVQEVVLFHPIGPVLSIPEPCRVLHEFRKRINFESSAKHYKHSQTCQV